MYLKSLEVIGFKSFADKTKLAFEPGITAIVGPNGCGKSNISDAIRWVLGEQSAKSMRGLSMQDCIFNGTDDKKPLGMAEVSLALANCEQALGTAYHEVTVTRRIFRSGESEYLINHAPCRLKDIHRLFMDTGIGVNAYSVLEQGRIDQILSSHPEDRRTIFEEASGITKYKSDKKDALRKLEYTEENLLRLADVLREVRRQINSLQRQVHKAQRYQEVQTKLRSYDIFLTQERCRELQQQINIATERLSAIAEREELIVSEIATNEGLSQSKLEVISNSEKEINNSIASLQKIQNDLTRAQEALRITQERQVEIQQLSVRDQRDLQTAQESEKVLLASRQEIQTKLASAEQLLGQAETALATESDKFSGVNKAYEDEARLAQQRHKVIQEEEIRLSRIKSEQVALENNEKAHAMRRERLQADEQKNLQAIVGDEQINAQNLSRLAELKDKTGEQQNTLQSLLAQRQQVVNSGNEKRNQLSQWQSQLAAKKAKIEILTTKEHATDPFPAGAKMLLKPPTDFPCNLVVGALADQVEADDNYQIPLEAVLRAWSDAIVVNEPITVLRELEKRQTGAARLVPAKMLQSGQKEENVSTSPQVGISSAASEGKMIEADVASGDGVALLDHVKGDAGYLQRLLAGVRVVKSLDELPAEIPVDVTYVTMTGCVINAQGLAEYWHHSSPQDNPLTRHHLIHNLQQEAKAIEQSIAKVQEEWQQLKTQEQNLEQQINSTRHTLDDNKRNLVSTEAEQRNLANNLRLAKERNASISEEIQELSLQEQNNAQRRTKLEQELTHQQEVILAKKNEWELGQELLVRLEKERQAMQTALNDARIRVITQRQETTHLQNREQPLNIQLQTIATTIAERTGSIAQYKVRQGELQDQLIQAEQSIPPLQEACQQQQENITAAQKKNEVIRQELKSIDDDTRKKRHELEGLRSQKSGLEVELAEQRLRQQNLVERICQEYHLATDDLIKMPEPDWGEVGRPNREVIESTVAELKEKLEAIGPVNLVAIEEHKELQERLTFLTGQQDDLVKSKEQLMELIRKLNKTTTEMFAQTFAQVNENFQQMFHKLFNGGTANLVLVDEADMLESGIDIIARPPGKKLQSISLLSGGERTMTAIALLFALYMVKASPFCVLDELDAALDDSNIGRFVETVKGFLDKSQFVVVTHNRQTMAAAAVLYGVTMERRGISKIVSVKFGEAN